MTTFYQLKLDQSIVDCGMSYVFHLTSNHFFMIDGGYFTPGEAEHLLSFLKQKCSGKPVIDGWFFSHAHQDHIGVFINMMEKYRDEIEVRDLIFTFQPLDLPETSEGWDATSNDLATVRKFYEVLDRYCRDIPVRTPHTGDCWNIGELQLEILYTYENMDGESTFNDHSTVLKVTCEGQSILFLGDVFKKGSSYMLTNKADKLRAMFVQVAHHGFKGATKELYQAADPQIALWPTAEYRMDCILAMEADRYLLYDSNIREHYFSFLGDVSFTLPYQPGTAKGSPYVPPKP